MQVTILGSGTAYPDAERACPAALVEVDGRRLLLDAGPGVTRRLAAAGVDLRDLDAVLLTHFHVDHCAGVPELLFAFGHPALERTRPLAIWAGSGFTRWMEGLRIAWPRHLHSTGYPLEEREIGPGVHDLLGLRVEAIEVAHKPESLAYRITDAAGRVLGFSGDSGPSDGLIACARNADLFVCECTTIEESPAPAHLTARQAGEHAARAGAGHLCLAHLGPDTWGHDVRARAAQAFAGEITVARDLLRLEVGRESPS